MSAPSDATVKAAEDACRALSDRSLRYRLTQARTMPKWFSPVTVDAIEAEAKRRGIPTEVTERG